MLLTAKCKAVLPSASIHVKAISCSMPRALLFSINFNALLNFFYVIKEINLSPFIFPWSWSKNLKPPGAIGIGTGTVTVFIIITS